jgi:sorbose reductase
MSEGAMNGGNFKHNNTIAPPPGNVLPLFSLKGRTAIVTGAGAGIGLVVAQALAEAGANVAIWYNGNKQALDEADKIEKQYGVKCTCISPLPWRNKYYDGATDGYDLLIGAHIPPSSPPG